MVHVVLSKFRGHLSTVSRQESARRIEQLVIWYYFDHKIYFPNQSGENQQNERTDRVMSSIARDEICAFIYFFRSDRLNNSA